MNVIIMVSEGYPKKFSANNSKGEFIAKGLKEAGCKVSMLDGIFGTQGYTHKETGISKSGIEYCILPRIGKYSAFFRLLPMIWQYLKEHKQKDDKNHLLMGLFPYPFYFIIVAMATILGYSRSTLFHEWHPSIKGQGKIKRAIAYIQDYTFGYFQNIIFPIGHYLQEKSKKFHKPMMLVPVLASYTRQPTINIEKNHFTYCGHANYLLRNTLVLDGFKKLITENPTIKASLCLILVGNKKNFFDINRKLQDYEFGDRVYIKSQLPQDELYSIYDSSIGLLIPLDPSNLQDTARFSQKIAEYVASKRPIITSNTGEIPYYFKNGESAIIVSFSADGYCEGMKTLCVNPKLADAVGEGGYQVGISYFDYKIVGRKLKDVIKRNC